MWVVTDRGFYSAVEAKDDPNFIVVRGRVRSDLEALLELVPGRHAIAESDTTDYRYRVKLTRRQWADALVQLAERIDYGNFKDAVAVRQGKRRHDVYTRVWSALYPLQFMRFGPRRKRRRARAS
jgi:hypothetical protein